MALINCEVSLTMTWFRNCVITSKVVRRRETTAVTRINNPTGATFRIKGTKLYVPVVTLSAEKDNKLLEQLKTGFKRTITWKKYRSEMSNQTKTNNLNNLIDPTFTKVNRLFVLSLENEADRISYKKYYVPKVEVKDFKVFIDESHFLTFL